MIYELEFDRRALKEWSKLDATIQQQFKDKLSEILHQPCIPANKLSQLPHCYKVKLRSSGYRLIYQVAEQELIVLVVAIGKREKSKAYQKASYRITSER